MYFNTKNYLKSNRNQTAKQTQGMKFLQDTSYHSTLSRGPLKKEIVVLIKFLSYPRSKVKP